MVIFSTGADALALFTPARCRADSTPLRSHAGTSFEAVTAADAEDFPSTKRLPSALSSRASSTSTFDTAEHDCSDGNSAGCAMVLYCSGTASVATVEGVEQ